MVEHLVVNSSIGAMIVMALIFWMRVVLSMPKGEKWSHEIEEKQTVEVPSKAEPLPKKVEEKMNASKRAWFNFLGIPQHIPCSHGIEEKQKVETQEEYEGGGVLNIPYFKVESLPLLESGWTVHCGMSKEEGRKPTAVLEELKNSGWCKGVKEFCENKKERKPTMKPVKEPSVFGNVVRMILGFLLGLVLRVAPIAVFPATLWAWIQYSDQIPAWMNSFSVDVFGHSVQYGAIGSLIFAALFAAWQLNSLSKGCFRWMRSVPDREKDKCIQKLRDQNDELGFALSDAQEKISSLNMESKRLSEHVKTWRQTAGDRLGTIEVKDKKYKELEYRFTQIARDKNAEIESLQNLVSGLQEEVAGMEWVKKHISGDQPKIEAPKSVQGFKDFVVIDNINCDKWIVETNSDGYVNVVGITEFHGRVYKTLKAHCEYIKGEHLWYNPTCCGGQGYLYTDTNRHCPYEDDGYIYLGTAARDHELGDMIQVVKPENDDDIPY